MIKKTVIQRVQFPDDRRILMISDIHGHCAGLKSVLAQAHFGKDDILVIVGDLIEKGPQSLQTLRSVMELYREYTVYPLIGNVDLWRLHMLQSKETEIQQKLLRYSLKAEKWWNISVLGELCREIGVRLSPDMDTQIVFARLREHFAEEFSFLDNLPVILETQKMIFVHGGLPHENLPALESEDCFPLLKRDMFLTCGLSFQKYVVVGHWPTPLYCEHIPCSNPVIDREKHIISLDGGMGLKDNGQLNLLAMDSWQSENFSLYTWDGLPRITALEAQSASEDSLYLHWAREPVTVTLLETQGDMARIVYKDHEMLIPAAFLREENGQIFCDDVTDYLLPVAPGDTLHPILTTSYGVYAKKGGVTGWYRGKYTKNQ